MNAFYTTALLSQQEPVNPEPVEEVKTPSPVDPDAITEFNITGIVAIACLTALEITAMITGHDGTFFLPLAALIGGLAGYKLPQGIFGGK